MDFDNLPTLKQIRAQRLLTPLQLAEIELWFRCSRLLDRPLEMSPGLTLGLHRLGMPSSLEPGEAKH